MRALKLTSCSPRRRDPVRTAGATGSPVGFLDATSNPEPRAAGESRPRRRTFTGLDTVPAPGLRAEDDASSFDRRPGADAMRRYGFATSLALILLGLRLGNRSARESIMTEMERQKTK